MHTATRIIPRDKKPGFSRRPVDPPSALFSAHCFSADDPELLLQLSACLALPCSAVILLLRGGGKSV